MSTGKETAEAPKKKRTRKTKEKAEDQPKEKVVEITKSPQKAQTESVKPKGSEEADAKLEKHIESWNKTLKEGNFVNLNLVNEEDDLSDFMVLLKTCSENLILRNNLELYKLCKGNAEDLKKIQKKLECLFDKK